MTVEVVRSRVLGVKFDGPLESLLRGGPIPLIEVMNRSQRNVSFAERVTQRYRPRRRDTCIGKSFLRRHLTLETETAIGVRQARICARVSRILVDGLLKILDPFSHSFVARFVPVVPALQVEPIRLRVLSR